jgi:signal transduction histidine kinase
MSGLQPAERTLGVIFVAVVGSFLATTCVVQRRSTEIDSLADSIVSNSTPSIERLACVRGATLELERALGRHLRGARPRRTSTGSELDLAIHALAGEVLTYYVLPAFPGEDRVRREVHGAWMQLEDHVKRASNLFESGDVARAADLAISSVAPASVKLEDAAVRALRFNAETARGLASAIRQSRRTTSWVATTLTACCAALGLGGAVLIAREARCRRAHALAHARALEARNLELELFAGRVAHDLRNPIWAVKLAADVTLRRAPDGAAGELARRVIRGTGRAEALITGLLAFARSGAKPDPGARTDVREVIEDLSAGAAQELTGAGIELRVEPVPPVLVACSTGVYLSLLGNLVRNAINYMGGNAVRRIDIRVMDERRMVRTEVADTGIGVAAESLPSLFEPYFQERARRREGLGLGLATVKKLAEGHHGQVGVRSVLGEGSTFWFVLPRAGTAVGAIGSGSPLATPRLPSSPEGVTPSIRQHGRSEPDVN